MKSCCKCNIIKDYSFFSKNKTKKDGYNNMCKICFSLYSKNYENTEKRKEYLRSEKRKEQHKISSKKNYNKESTKLRLSIYYKENEEYVREYKRLYNIHRKKTDELYRLKTVFRSNIAKCFKRNNHRKKSSTTEILGCSFEFFKNYIENKFENWMTWDNYGNKLDKNGMSWDLDHIKPLALAKSEEEMIKLNHYTNFQPLDSKINRFYKKDNYQPAPPFPTK